MQQMKQQPSTTLAGENIIMLKQKLINKSSTVAIDVTDCQHILWCDDAEILISFHSIPQTIYYYYYYYYYYLLLLIISSLLIE